MKSVKDADAMFVWCLPTDIGLSGYSYAFTKIIHITLRKSLNDEKSS
jgi:hypothetical protein